MKAEIKVVTQFESTEMNILKEGEQNLGSITYSNNSDSDLHRFIDDLNDRLDVYCAQIENWNRASVLGSNISVKRVVVTFKRDDSTIIDEIAIHPDTVIQASKLITAFYTC